MSASGPVLDYVAKRLLPLMGIAGRNFTARPPLHAGEGSRLSVVRIEGMPPLLLRSHATRREAVKNAEALRHLDTLGLPAPRLVAHDLSGPSRLLRGESAAPCVTVETWIEGTPHADLTEPAPVAEASLGAARLLARWHDVTRLRWGRPSGARLWSYAAYTMAGTRRMARALGTRGWLGEAEARDVQGKFLAWRPALSSIDSFSLVHNDLSRRHLIVSDSGEVVPVTLHRLSYEPFLEELINTSQRFCRDQAGLGDRFLDAYFEMAGPAALSRWETLRGFFEPLGALKKMYRRGRHLARSDDPKMDGWKRQVLAITPPR
jgi:hypothetical protein